MGEGGRRRHAKRVEANDKHLNKILFCMSQLMELVFLVVAIIRSGKHAQRIHILHAYLITECAVNKSP